MAATVVPPRFVLISSINYISYYVVATRGCEPIRKGGNIDDASASRVVGVVLLLTQSFNGKIEESPHQTIPNDELSFTFCCVLLLTPCNENAVTSCKKKL